MRMLKRLARMVAVALAIAVAAVGATVANFTLLDYAGSQDDPAGRLRPLAAIPQPPATAERPTELRPQIAEKRDREPKQASNAAATGETTTTSTTSDWSGGETEPLEDHAEEADD